MDKMYETKHSSDWFYFPMEFVILVYLSFARSHFAMVCVSHTPIVFQLVFVVALPCEFRLLSVDLCHAESILFLLVLLLHTLCIIRMHLRHCAYCTYYSSIVCAFSFLFLRSYIFQGAYWALISFPLFLLGHHGFFFSYRSIGCIAPLFHIYVFSM